MTIRQMRRLILAVAVMVAGSFAAQSAYAENAADGKFPFSIKAYALRGMYLDKNTHFEKFGPANYPAGINLGFELPSTQQRPWQQYLGNPTAGVGVTWMDLGHKMLGHTVAVYPYILLDAIDTEHFQMRFKIAGGLACVTEHWYTQEDQDPEHYYEPTVNTVFGCYLNVYLNAAINLNVPVTKYLALGGEFGYFHMSNGRTCMPNIGANALYGSLGLTATLNSEVRKTPVQFPDQPYGWALNITGAAGAHKAAIADKHRFLISSLHAGAVYHVNNWYGIGAGLDVFYNGAIDNNTDRNLYRKDREYTTMDKIRAGLALNNEFKFGVITAILDWGVYFFNPSRHYYANTDHPIYGGGRRPLFYKNDGAGTDEAFHYIRFGLKYRVWDNLYLHTSAKTHLHICEYVEFGLGYQIPFFKKEHSDKGLIFHHKKGWWKEF